MVPKGFRTNININPSKIGVERRQELLDNITNKDTFLPKGVNEKDMDDEFNRFVEKTLSLTIDGVSVPVIFLTLQRWAQFEETWGKSDEYKDIKLPFIAIVRKPDAQVGQNQAGLYNIPGNRTYTIMKVPTFDGIRSGFDLYQIPQPTSVDISYDVKLYTTKLKDINAFNSKILRTFQSRQAYVYVKGHPMPIHLESISDESELTDIDGRRFYVQNFNMVMLGYLMDESEFKIIPSINRVLAVVELDEYKKYPKVVLDEYKNNNSLVYTIVFKPRSEQSFSFIAKYDMVFTKIDSIENITNIVIRINNVTVFNGLNLLTPITISNNDDVWIGITKANLVNGKFQLIGNT